jgi:general secretion pathway protein A
MLSNLETSTEKLIQIILCGQPEFEQLLKLKELRQFKQRVAIRWKIVPFSRGESRAYIQHRMAKAAAKESNVFTRGALRKVVKQSGIQNYQHPVRQRADCRVRVQKRPVNSQIVRQVITDLDMKQRPRFRDGR